MQNDINVELANINAKIAHKAAKIAALNARKERLNDGIMNHKNFCIRYSEFIDGPDGLFGVFSDEVLVNILTFLPIRILLKPPCHRFLQMRDYILSKRTYKGIESKIIYNFESECKIPRIVLHFMLETETIRRPFGSNTDEFIYRRDATINEVKNMFMYKVTNNISLFNINTNLKFQDLAILKDDNNIVVYTHSKCIVISRKENNIAILDRITGLPIRLSGIFSSFNSGYSEIDHKKYKAPGIFIKN
jgi:hypothetical protein